MEIIRCEFNLKPIASKITENEISWFKEIYSINILNTEEIKGFISSLNFKEIYNFFNDMIRWIGKLALPVDIKRCSFEVSFIMKDVDLSFIENKNFKEVIPFAFIKYVFVNGSFYRYIGNINDVECIQI